MLGFSIQKLLVLAGIIAAVWYGFKLVGRMKQTRDAQARAGAKSTKSANLGDQLRGWMAGRQGGNEPGGEGGGAAEDLIPCPKCGAYVAASGASSCGRSDCPY